MCSKGVRGFKMTRQRHASCATQKHLYPNVGQVLNKAQNLCSSALLPTHRPMVWSNPHFCQTQILIVSSSTRGKRLRSLFIRSSDLSNTEQTQDTRSDSTFQPWWSNVTTISHAHFSGLSERWEGKHLEIYAGTGP